MTATDLRYGRRGGGWVPSGARSTTAAAPRLCEVCGFPMLVGQKRRHVVCSPQLACCGAFEDAVPDLAKHRRDHAEVDAETDRRMMADPNWDGVAHVAL